MFFIELKGTGISLTISLSSHTQTIYTYSNVFQNSTINYSRNTLLSESKLIAYHQIGGRNEFEITVIDEPAS